MNYSIFKRLSNQAAGSVPNDLRGCDWQLEYDKIFAELIVRECLKQCEQVRDSAYTQKKSEYLTESGRLIYEGVFGGANNCGFAIQEHFGIKDE